MKNVPTPTERVEAAMNSIKEVCSRYGVRVVTQIKFEPTSAGDRGLLDAEWAVAAVRGWTPPVEAPLDPKSGS